ncbi:MAG: type III pantothenate kinase, partial [Bacteroidales bacterium]
MMTFNKVKNLIAIDIGNSLIKTLIINDNENVYKQTDKWEKIKNEIEEYTKSSYHVIISNVNNTILNSIINSFNQKNVLLLDHFTPLPIKNNYKTPTTLGYDRIAAAVGANELFPNLPCLIIDAGTAITIDLINNSSYEGGAISPGIEMRYKALNQFTNKLPMLNKTEHFSYPGKNTNESIHSGVIQGVVFELERRIEAFQEIFPEGKTIITGGDCLY